MKKVAIVQSNYIPWKGYFDLIASVDKFIIYDDVQFTRRDWRNRNQIKTPEGVKWITVPVKVKGKFQQSIIETELDGTAWRELHWKTLCQNYKKSSYFSEISCLLEDLYRRDYNTISELNLTFIEVICNYLSINTEIDKSSNYSLAKGKTERLVDLCKQSGATIYLSGPSARNYISSEAFLEAGIDLLWFNYEDYPEYPQLWGDFSHNVSILDLLFNCGKKSRNYMKFTNGN